MNAKTEHVKFVGTTCLGDTVSRSQLKLVAVNLKAAEPFILLLLLAEKTFGSKGRKHNGQMMVDVRQTQNQYVEAHEMVEHCVFSLEMVLLRVSCPGHMQAQSVRCQRSKRGEQKQLPV